MANPDWQFVIPKANRGFVADRLGCSKGRALGLGDGKSKSVPSPNSALSPSAKGDEW